MLHPEAQIGSLQRGPDQPSWQSYIYQVKQKIALEFPHLHVSGTTLVETTLCGD